MTKKQIFCLSAGLILLGVFVMMAFFPSMFTPYEEKEMFKPWLKVSKDHILGTNSLGYDIFTELVAGTRETLLIGVSSSVLALLLGASAGTLSTSKGHTGSFFNGLINIFVLLPRLITIIVLSAFIGQGTGNLIFLIAIFSWVGTARAVRSKVIHLNSEPFIENCVIEGFSRPHIVIWHILPNLQDVLLSRFLLGVNSCIMMESTLSFLGFGSLYHPTWGTMINFAYKRGAFIRHAYNYLLVPGICIMLLSLSFYFLSLFIEERQTQIRES